MLMMKILVDISWVSPSMSSAELVDDLNKAESASRICIWWFILLTQEMWSLDYFDFVKFCSRQWSKHKHCGFPLLTQELVFEEFY